MNKYDRMKAMWNNVIIAESDHTEIVEGNHYFPFDSIKSEYFTKTELTTVCGWKGKANYYSVTVDGKINKDCAWYYAEPNSAASKIKGMVAFWNGINIK
ncbi:MAG: DUF427 domain-containing protein [Candidatus Nitrosopumilus limneticus]|nr:DUF427 domain-containing protein [Candidatus Nitrosopumilus limneticus]